jgi:hypothetical protein
MPWLGGSLIVLPRLCGMGGILEKMDQVYQKNTTIAGTSNKV